MTTNGYDLIYAQNNRNPSPPPLTENEKDSLVADHVGDTIFSKRFILSTLLKLYKHEQDDIYASLDENEEIEEIGAETLNTQFEKDICEVWDSTANSDVSMFIFENQGKDIFLDAIEKTTSPRLTEICFGVLGNLICVDSINEFYSQDSTFRTTILGYLCITDALCLVELTRLLNVCFGNSETLALWMCTVRNTSSMENVVTILQNSLNVQLLQHIIQLIDIIFDTDSELMNKYANATLFYAVRESYHVIRNKNEELVPDLLYLLQLVSTTENGVEQLAVDDSTFLLLNQCINDQQNLFIGEKPMLLVSVFSILGCLLFAKPVEIVTLINQNINILEYLITTLHQRISTLVDDVDETIYDDDSYIPVYLEIFHDICQIYCTHRDFVNIFTCLKDREVKIKDIFDRCNKENIPSEWKKFIKNISLLNKQHCILDFLVELKY